MAGARVEITVNTAGPAIKEAQRRLSPDGVTLMLEDMGEYLLRSTRDRADREVTPDGQPWMPLSPAYQRRKAEKRPGRKILRLDNHMLGDRLASQVAGATLFHGTSAPYGATQHFGRGGIPARPWVGLSDDDHEELELIARDHIAGAFSE